jgi:protein SCO1/2
MSFLLGLSKKPMKQNKEISPPKHQDAKKDLSFGGISSSFLKKTLFFGLAFAGLVFFGYRILASRPSDKLQNPISSAPDFSFQERSGRVFSSSELKGKIWVVDFIFAHCAGSCPLLSQKMSKLQDAWRGNPNLKLVTFTVDPDRDTAQALLNYANDYHADPNQWFFLTGKKADVYKTIRGGFKEIADANPEGGPGFDFIHTTRMVLVDGNGKIRGLYDGEDDADVKKLWQDVKYLMSSRSHS